MQCKFGTIKAEAGHPLRRLVRPALERRDWNGRGTAISSG
jgi:hypothetical protein